jgi:Transglycosylase SLT domain
MKRMFILGVACAALSVYLSTVPAHSASKYKYKDEHQVIYHQQTIYQQIYQAAVEFHQSYYWLVRVAQCESGLNPYAYNRYSAASGLFQFLPTTFWYYVYRLRWMPGTWLSPFNSRVAARLTAYMWAIGQAHQWTCAYIVGYL